MMAGDYPDPTRHPSAYRAHEAAPADTGDEVVIHMVEGGGAFRDGFPVLGTVRRIDEPNGLSPRNDYVLRVHIPDEQAHFMADGHGTTTILTQLRRGKSWVTLDEFDGGVTELLE
ncbi:hypothetical protein G3A49_13450 [Haloferax volcanii]|uniref:Uncharacterized protein n=2 Tax=Haloferax volcanii TaxID=2246 RepID=A0A6C0UUC4_HALVO|nr:hypothetical protein G3A49_13450 [Haloferax alexandrinus]